MMYYKKDLLENILPFWLEHAMDEENGGILSSISSFFKKAF